MSILTATERVVAAHTEAEWANLSKSMPLGRAGQPADIGEGVNFLATDESAFMTGQMLHVNGGMIFNESSADVLSRGRCSRNTSFAAKPRPIRVLESWRAILVRSEWLFDKNQLYNHLPSFWLMGLIYTTHRTYGCKSTLLKIIAGSLPYEEHMLCRLKLVANRHHFGPSSFKTFTNA